MTADLDGFRELVGIMPDARLAVLAALTGPPGDPLAGPPAGLDDLVRVSALPRREVQDFLTALDGVEGVDGAGGGELAGPFVLSPDARDRYRELTGDFRAHRPVVRPQDEDGLLGVAERLIRAAPPPRRRFDHVQATPETLVRRVAWLTATFDLAARPV